jgi:DUF1680 family protein
MVHAASPLVDNSRSPHARVRSVGLDDVRWTDGFWARHFATARAQTIPGMWRLMSGTTPKQYLENFRIAAGLTEGRHRGAPFNDGDFYKWLEAACVMFGLTGEAELGRQIDEAIDAIARAQRPDGHLHTPVLVRARNGDPDAVPFQDRHNFEMYNMGHLMTTACVHHRITGKTTLLTVAVKAADFLYKTFTGAQIITKTKDAEPEAETVFGKKDSLAYYSNIADAFADVADGLQHAHSKGVTHRDIKPSNLILDQDGRLRIPDFGLARLEGQESLTISGDLVGTPLYMSPGPEEVCQKWVVSSRTP